MSMHGVRTLFSARCLTALALLFFVYPALHADKPKAAAPAKAAPAKAAAPAKSGGAGASASHSTGSANTSHGANTSSGHSPTTTGGASHTTGSTTGSHGATGTSTGHTGTSGGAGASHGTGATGGQHYGSNTPGGHTNAAAHPGGAGGHGAPTPHGHTTMQTSHGSVTRRPDGRVAGFHDNRRGMDVHHGINGSRHVMVERGDHSRVYVGRGGRGYVQRPYMYHGHEYARRSYYHDGHYYNHYYGRYYYHGMYMNPYFPSYYYGAAFYGWAYNPWVNPIAYGWGWGGNPWYGYYGSYFTPYPVYAAPSLWLTDYLIANSLQAAYQANQAALANPAPLTPEVKALIADEVKQQVALENHEAANPNAEPDAASSSIQRLLTDGKPHVFVAGSDLDVTDAGGNECALSEGDAIQLRGQVAPDAQAANLAVLASKGGKECPRGDVVSVALQDLQDMQNHMRETIDAGLQELQKKQGQGGLPAAPAAAKAAPVESQMAAIAPPPPPESEVAAEINQQSQAADQAEKEASTDAGSGPGPNAAAPAAEPVSVDVGQTIDQVTAALGTPLKIVNLGAKKIYVFKDMKVTFLNGKVSDVQ